MIKFLKKIVKKIPPISLLVKERELLMKEKRALTKEKNALIKKNKKLTKFVPPGHFYSPIPNISETLKNSRRIWKTKKPEEILEIDFNIKDQLKLLEKFEPYYREIPFKAKKSKSLRYFFENPAYSYSDAVFLYCMIRHAKPKKLIEVGSGYSSCVTLDTNELFFNNSINCEFIDPYPKLLKSLLKSGDEKNIKIHKSKLQDIPINLFKSLKANDILFIDSTHVSKIDSDVNYIFHEILPALNDGVYIHFHDVFYPFEYPKVWIIEGRAWNEDYILRAFLQYNSRFKIVLFNTLIENLYRDKLSKRFPLIFKNEGGSIWIKKEQEK